MITFKNLRAITTLIVLGLGLAGCSSSSKSSDVVAIPDPIKPSVSVPSWYPSDYERWRSSSLAYKSIGGPCQEEEPCVRWKILSKEHCSGLQASINVTHFEPFEGTIKYGKVLGPFAAGEPVVLEFATHNKYAVYVSLEELECS